MSIDSAAFKERLLRFLNSWKDDESGAWTDISAVIIVTGKRDPAVLQYLKSVAFHQWLFGIEVADVVLLFTKSEMKIVSFEGKKAKVLEALKPAAKEAGCPLSFLLVPKGGDAASACKEAIQFAKGSGGNVAGLAKLKQNGTLCDAFGGAIQSEGVELADAALPIGRLLVTHDRPSDLQNSKKAGFLTSSVMNVAVKKIEDSVDKRKHAKHSKLSELVQEIITNPAKHQIKLKADACEYAYLPIVASGGHFPLRIGAECDNGKLHDGVILLHLGAKYNSECANICRTLFFQPTTMMEKMYTAVLTAQKAAIQALQPGKPLSAAHGAAVVALTSSGFEDLVPKLVKSVGFGTGLELRESRLQLTATNETPAAPKMVFNVSVGIQDLNNPDAADEKDQKFAIQVADTVAVAENGSPEILTRFSGSTWNDVSYVIKEDEDAGASDLDELDNLHDNSQHRSSRENIAEQNLGRGRRNAARAADTAENAENAMKRKKRQDELSKRKNEETYKRLTAKAGDEDGEKNHMRSVTNAACYQSVASVPPRRNTLISIDPNAEALLIPVMGMLIPIHIMTVKSIIYSQDGESNDKVHSFVRIQFHHNTQYDARTANPTAALIKELAFRSTNSTAAQKFVQEAQALRRQVAIKDKEAAERATLVTQDKLQRYTNRQPHRLQDVWMQPAISSKRKVPGNLDAHYNGFRYQMQGGESLDVTFSNIRHAFFQESDNELITLVHFTLKDPIMAGKKKVKDVQFYTEVMENNTAVDGRRSAYDPDEIEEERRDRERRLKINNEFRRFTRKVQEQWDNSFASLKLEWDTPFRDLAFSGIRGKSTVTLMPTVHCLVQLIEPPYTVIPLEDVEIVNLERVGFNGKTFDLVVVFKDFDRETLMVGSIPSQSLDDIKNWLTTQDIKFFESKLNLQWKQILKTIVADPDEFLQTGGWAGFLDADGSEGEQEEEEVSEEFKPSSEEDDDEEESDEDSGGSVVDSDDESEDGDFSNDSEEEEGKDWDALEEEARRADKIRDVEAEDEPQRTKGGGKGRAPDRKRPHSSMGGSKHSGKPVKRPR